LRLGDEYLGSGSLTGDLCGDEYLGRVSPLMDAPALEAEWARPPVVDGLNGELEPKVLCLDLAAEVARSALSASSSIDLVGGLEERRNSANSE
jgi:hypothetical protein